MVFMRSVVLVLVAGVVLASLLLAAYFYFEIANGGQKTGAADVSSTVFAERYHGYSPLQRKSLSALNIPIVLPGWLPDGLRVAHVYTWDAGVDDKGYVVTYGNGQSSVEFKGRKIGAPVIGGADVPAAAFVARFRSKLFGPGTIDRDLRRPQCYSEANGPMRIARASSLETGYIIESCGDVVPSQPAGIVNSAHIVHQ